MKPTKFRADTEALTRASVMEADDEMSDSAQEEIARLTYSYREPQRILERRGKRAA